MVQYGLSVGVCVSLLIRLGGWIVGAIVNNASTAQLGLEVGAWAELGKHRLAVSHSILI